MPAIDIQELRPTPINRSTWTLPTYLVPERFDGYRTSRSLPAGTRNGYCADIGARLSFYKSPEDIDEQVAAAVANGSQITFLRSTTTDTGSPRISIRQGRAFKGSRGPGYMPRGHRTRGYVLDGVIDLITDNNPVSVTTLAAKWYLGTNVPLTTELTKEALYTATNASPIAAIATYPAGLGDNPRQVSGCVWIITEVRGDMPSGYLWSPTSSVYSGPQTTNVNDIVGIAALSLASPKITPADCSQLPRDPKEAYRSIFGA